MKRKFEDKKRDTLKRKRKPLMFLSLEGNNKTEKLYLKALNNDNNKYALVFTPGRESDPINMYKSLKKTIKESFNEDDGDKAYCICDRDFEVYKLDKLMKIRQDKTNEKKVSVIVSNPCFEIWYLNHFTFYTKEMMSYKELEKTLCKYIDCYSKNGEYYNQLKDKTYDAIKNSIRQLNKSKSKNEEEVLANPSTETYKIVQEIIGK